MARVSIAVAAVAVKLELHHSLAHVVNGSEVLEWIRHPVAKIGAATTPYSLLLALDADSFERALHSLTGCLLKMAE